MKKLVYLFSFLAAFGLSSCEEDSTEATEDPTNNGGSNSVTNNSIVVGAQSADLNLYTAYIATDFNTNKDYIDIFIYKDNPANRENYLQLTLHEIPSSSKTLTWQAGSSAPGDLGADEFTMFPKVADKRWYGVYSTNGFETTGEMQATVNGSKLTLSFENIELADNFISANVTEREDVSGKVTFNLADLQNLTNSITGPKNLVDE